MVFSSPSWVPQIPCEIPDSVPVGQFALEGNAKLPPQCGGKPPFVCAITGKSYSSKTVSDRVDFLSRALARELGWSPNEGSPEDKVVGIYSWNTLDFFALCWAVHRLNGICLPLHPFSIVPEIVAHMKNAKCKVLVTCQSLISNSLEAAKELSLPEDRVYTMALPEGYIQNPEPIDHLKSVDQLIADGEELETLPPLKWEHGRAKTQVAYYCATGGTSGKQKLAKISHYNFIANVIQACMHESYAKSGRNEIAFGAIPLTHGYGLNIGHIMVYRGDTYVITPRFDMQLMLKTIERFRVERLYVVPPILAALAANPFLLDLHDLSSVRDTVTGAAALDRNVSSKLHQLRPTWSINHAYGLTETGVIVSLTSPHDVWHGSSGSLLPSFEIRLIRPDGTDIENLDEPGEVYFNSPSCFVGYVGDEESNKNIFDEKGWLKSGDIGVFRTSPKGYPHLFILDRIKDMIKVKGDQVLPRDIESVLLSHPAITDAAVIGVADELSGERAKAYIVRSKTVMEEMDEDDLADEIDEFVQARLHESHWLQDRIVFLEKLPKSEAGKVLKKELRALN
ncbi:acyl--CoA ligase [Aspergillus mulundensis]|uniref:AMP-dependent CoA ligase n=1 Tax=Aspergillus mulundensis TaxID=1810919 RepID=A0A0G3EUT8_9EURO|nr:AMP-dependent CoA ligase [Aspergillus mulundensis]AKJ70934.1 AMP-dependent CoA ligase [Aspergillus mulundensis]RDW67404.1 AMP-dependent CoA ligase [Aspergillus mulundensis]